MVERMLRAFAAEIVVAGVGKKIRHQDTKTPRKTGDRLWGRRRREKVVSHKRAQRSQRKDVSVDSAGSVRDNSLI